ncbi:hypothetical protein [Rubrolithibacter danxiaensis]|uniref:hypothetical protein n=1 Tax=Rubrolithibacter danxiaensis TaxID=3390805 RepID=UPI003BF8922D
MTQKRFLILFLALTAIAGIAAYLIDAFLINNVLVPKFWVLFGFIAIITLIVYMVASVGIKKGGEISVYSVLGSIVVKLLFSMAFILVYLLKFSVNSVYFIVEFFSLYFLFTAFEVYCLLRNLRHQNKT